MKIKVFDLNSSSLLREEPRWRHMYDSFSLTGSVPEFLDSHGDAKELVFGGGDDHVGFTQHLQVIVFTGQEAPVQDVTVQQMTGLRKDLCRISGGEEETHR